MLQTHENQSFRDELNFAEFPLAALTDSVSSGEQTLTFTDTIFDRGSKQPVTRRLTISASNEYGLPTPLDDEVILGLIQVSKEQEFVDRRVYFTRRRLLRLLGWSLDSKSYGRLKQSLLRWVGVTLHYERAWWSKEQQCWVDEVFHILENVTIYDQERREAALRSSPAESHAGRSSFVWNEVVFKSFKAGNIKQIDWHLYRQLSTPIAKRMFRFLDKRFYQRSRIEFDLRMFACEKIGISKGAPNAEIKRRLRPGLAELERVGFLKVLPDDQRFRKLAHGQWQVVFIRNHEVGRGGDTRQNDSVQILIDRGVSPTVARELVQSFDQVRIEEKVALLDRLKQTKRAPRNPAGFLVQAIRANYSSDQGLSPAVSRPIPRNASPASASPADTDDAATTERARFDAFWNSLSPEEQTQFEAKALEMTDKFLLGQYWKGKEHGGTLFRVVRQSIIDAHIKRQLQKQAA